MPKKVLLVGNKNGRKDVEEVLAQIAMPFEICFEVDDLKARIVSGDFECAIFDDDAFPSDMSDMRLAFLEALKKGKKRYIFVTSTEDFRKVDEASAMGAYDFVLTPHNYREFILRLNASQHRRTRITCVGGGTGLFNILASLKTLPNIMLTSIVGMSDDGGSSGRLRASFGILPPGDVRRSLIALSNAPELMNLVMQYRFRAGDESLTGHNFGNLFLAALSDIKGSMKEAVRSMGDILNIQGIVAPVTGESVTLNAKFEDGTVIKGESKIDMCVGRHPDLHISEFWHEPAARCSIDAYAAIIFADAVIIGPGDLYTSVITNFLFKHFPEAIAKTAAKKIYICNLMTKQGETASFSAYDHIREIIKYLGGDYLSYVIISNTILSHTALKAYAAKGQHPVEAGNINRIESLTKAEIIVTDVGHETDLVRHDSEKVKDVIAELVGESV
ncbi:MAG: YvcK family protein [Candidatus Omnitrophica bacterium]|nr:YvcK family protein [Candidatus Omnitrophota bacterium]